MLFVIIADDFGRQVASTKNSAGKRLSSIQHQKLLTPHSQQSKPGFLCCKRARCRHSLQLGEL
jgi:hypothetical protein